MDLIAGLQGETFEDFEKSLNSAISLNPENITVHTLCVKKGSSLAEETQRLSAGDVENMVEHAHAMLNKAGYSPYYLYRQKYMAGNLENTGYTKPGKACIYNVDVMEETTDNLAVGSNAVSKRVYNGLGRIERFASQKDLKTYIEGVDELIVKKRKFFE